MSIDDKYSAKLIANQSESNLLELRASFSTWLAERRLFETLATFAQVQIVISIQIDTLAAISNQNGVFLYLHREALEHYRVDPEILYFLLMHELRHLAQSRSVRDWRHLISFAPLVRALQKSLPLDALRRAGIADIEGDFDLKHEIFNLAADAAIHEDLRGIFGTDVMDRLSRFMTQRELQSTSEVSSDPLAEVGPVTVPLLEKITRTPLESDQDWLYYAKNLVKSLALRVQAEPGLAHILVDRQILRRISERGVDKHQIDYDSLSSIDQILGRAKGESRKLVESYLAHSNASDLLEGNDIEEVYQARKELNQAVKQIIELVRSAITRGQRRKNREIRTYGRPHLFLAGFPGKAESIREGDVADSVLVLDTSGSMWIPELLEQMAMVAYHLEKRELICRAYCCDVQVHRLENMHSGTIRFKGMGGTAWTREHNTEILRDLNTDRKINIYYCTDEDVFGLEDAMQDDRVQLTVINVPRLIQPDLHSRARL